jgi:hypothetical protein
VEIFHSTEDTDEEIGRVSSHWGSLLQRLFSTFANGWPGKGLLILRLALGLYALNRCVVEMRSDASSLQIVVALGGGFAAIFVVIGLWTPIAASLLALVGLVRLIFLPPASWDTVLAGAIGLALSLIGPGATSVDAQSYGRRRISITKH